MPRSFATNSTGDGFVPYTGATQDVDLGLHAIKSDSIITTDTNQGLQLWNGGHFGFFSDNGLTETGSIDTDLGLGIYEFLGATAYGVFDFNSITGSDKTYTLPNHTGNVLVDGADIDIYPKNFKANTVTADGFEAINQSSFDFFSDAGITNTGYFGGSSVVGQYSLGAGTALANAAILDFRSLSGTDKTFTFPNISGTVMVSSGTGQFADNETPTGTINGSNVTFTLANSPSPTASLQLIYNGQFQLQGTDYTLSGATITFASAPDTGTWVRAFYRY